MVHQIHVIIIITILYSCILKIYFTSFSIFENWFHFFFHHLPQLTSTQKKKKKIKKLEHQTSLTLGWIFF